MTNEISASKKGILRSDQSLIGGIIVFYIACMCSLIGLTIWGLGQRNTMVSANATATSAALTTQQAHATFTAVANTTEQSQYEFIETFDTISARWYIGIGNESYGDTTYA